MSLCCFAEMEKNFDEIDQELRTQAAGQLRARHSPVPLIIVR